MTQSMKSFEHFYSKILLFGEYGVIWGSQALSIPFTYFSGRINFVNNDNYTDIEFAKSSNLNLQQFCEYLEKSAEFHTLDFDFKSFKADLSQGLFFESTIPQGYGVGSSGALVAATYIRYMRNPVKRNLKLSSNLMLELKSVFSIMESFFHGKSSGIDPLISFIKYPLHLKDKKEISIVGIPRHQFNSEGAIFLLDTSIKGETQIYVNQFLNLCSDKNYLNNVLQDYIPTVNSCINNLIDGNETQFFTSLSQLSEYQRNSMEQMIPENIFPIWENGLNTGDYYLKLCGSGGGGFVLGFTINYENCRKYMQSHGFEPTLVYKSEN